MLVPIKLFLFEGSHVMCLAFKLSKLTIFPYNRDRNLCNFFAILVPTAAATATTTIILKQSTDISTTSTQIHLCKIKFKNMYCSKYYVFLIFLFLLLIVKEIFVTVFAFKFQYQQQQQHPSGYYVEEPPDSLTNTVPPRVQEKTTITDITSAPALPSGEVESVTQASPSPGPFQQSGVTPAPEPFSVQFQASDDLRLPPPFHTRVQYFNFIEMSKDHSGSYLFSCPLVFTIKNAPSQPSFYG